MGNVICWSTAGALGFKGSKKSTPYAAQQAVEDAVSKQKNMVSKSLVLRFKVREAVERLLLRVLEALKVLKYCGLKMLLHCHIMAAAHQKEEECKEREWQDIEVR